MKPPRPEGWLSGDPPAFAGGAVGEVVPGLAERLAREGERRFLFAPVCLGAGVVVFFALSRDPWLPALLAAALLSGGAALLFRPGSPARHLAGAACLVMAGLVLAALRTAAVDAPVVPPDARARLIEAVVERVERDPEKGDRVTLAVVRMAGLAPERTPRRVTVRSRIAGAEYPPGAVVALRAVLLPPPDPARPGGFDFARQAFFAGIGGTGYAVSRPDIRATRPPTARGRIAAGIERLRDAIAARVRQATSPVAGAVAVALVTGQRSYIPETVEEDLRDAGLAHILAISGLHMMLVVGAMFAGLRYAAALVPQVAVTRPVKKWAAAAALLVGTAYLAISGASVATQRAYIMAAVLLVAVLFDRPAITMRNVALAALLLLVLRPDFVTSAGFQMSFAATVALVAAYEALRLRRASRADDRPARRGAWRVPARYAGGLLLTSLVAGAATAPFAAYHFHRVAVYGLLGNLAALPLFGFVVMPAGLLGTLLIPFGLDAPFFWVMGQGLEVILAAADRVAGLPGARREVAAFPGAALVAMTLGALWFGLWRTGWRRLGLAVVAAGVLVAATADAPDLFVDREARLVALRGDGDAVGFVGRRGAAYEREQWLAAWGLPSDGGAPAGACDELACYAAAPPLAVSVVRHPAAFAADCPRAQLVVAAPAAPGWCGETALVVAASDLRTSGALAAWIAAAHGEAPALRLQSVSATTGDRPWNWRWRAYGPPTLPARPEPAQ